LFLERMLSRESVCVRHLARGGRAAVVGFGRFLANERVSLERLIEGWGEEASQTCAGRHVLAIQDLSEINLGTRPNDRRGLGEIGHGTSHGLLLHAMVAVDADDGGLLGLVSGRVWTRQGRVSVPHAKRPLSERESERWLTTAEAAKSVLGQARCVTVIADRESDIYAEWARLPQADFHLLTRAMKDRRTTRGKLSDAALQPVGEAQVVLRAQPGRPERQVRLAARFGTVSITRPAHGGADELPKAITLALVEVREVDPPAQGDPILWRLLTTHDVQDAEGAWRIIGWYRQRWIIEQLFRTLKQQGLKLEDSQITDASRLVKLTAIATKAACLTLQLVQARDGRSEQPASIAFSPSEIETLEALIPELEGKTQAQKNPHPRHSLARAAWVIAKLGGWDGYASSKPPGPITMRNGLQDFKSITRGHSMRDV
jgi:hypothetical protein